MKASSLLLLYVLSCIFVHLQVQAWIGVEKFNPDSILEQTSHCFGAQFNVGAMDKSESKRIETICAVAECGDDRSVKYTGCAPMRAKPPCYLIEGDISKPFPECCYEKICPDDNLVDSKPRSKQ